MDSANKGSKAMTAAILLAVSLVGIGWAWIFGDAILGVAPWVLALVSAGIPLFFLWVVYSGFRRSGRVGQVHSGLMVVATVVTMVVAYQPWSPRAQFVRTLYSIQPGMSQQDVERKMAGFSRGKVVEDVRNWDEVRKGTTHTVNYKWTGNADLGRVYLRDGRVVYRDFSPD